MTTSSTKKLASKKIPNPVAEHEKDLLKNRDIKSDYRLSDGDKEILFNALDNHANPEMKQICPLSYYCGFRRSEIVPLRWDQVHLDKNYIQLHETKSGQPRKVIITKEARKILEGITKNDNQPRLFTYTLFGFSGSVDKLIERIGLKEKGFRFHFFRREAISNLVFNIGKSTGIDGAKFSILISELLGIENVRNLEKRHLADLPTNKLAEMPSRHHEFDRPQQQADHQAIQSDQAACSRLILLKFKNHTF